MKKRQYKMRQRAQNKDQTRKKIVEATAELHGSVGPGNTTISAVAEKAGVQRLTVYRHFPDEESLFRACSSHWLSLNPPPDILDWQDIKDRTQRTAYALSAIYDYYQKTQSMWRLVYRDRDEVPALQEPLNAFHGHLEQICNDLYKSQLPDGRKNQKLRATINHLLLFNTWASLDAQKLDNASKTDLALSWIQSVAG